MAANPKYYNTGGGELFFTPITNGVLGAEVPFGQTENVAFSSSVETITHDNTEGSVTFEDASILNKITGKITIESLEISPSMLTRAFLATDFTTTVSAATGVTSVVGVSAFDTPLAIGKKLLSNVIVKDATDTTTYVSGTDYTVDAEAGTITVLSAGGTIVVGDDLHVTYDNASYKDIRVEAFLQSKVEGKLRFVSNSANGVSYTYTFHKVSLLASGDFNLKSATEFNKISFEGAMLASELITANDESKLFVITGTEAV